MIVEVIVWSVNTELLALATIKSITLRRNNK